MNDPPDQPTDPLLANPANVPRAPPRAARAALAELAFGSFAQNASGRDSGGAHLALHPIDAIELDLSDPAQRKFGDYELLEQIGEGGMGVVYRARQQSLDREVAIKLLAAGPWASREFIERFKREAQHAARMAHPNIVTVYEVGTVEQLHFFSMRLVRGTSLAARLRRHGPFDAREAACLMRTVAEAVAYAHSLDVLHLDLKPGNVLLDETGMPYVADFGLARRLNRMLAVENTEVAGTPSYMAPEQTRMHEGHLSAATDIWSLGAICHELVTGHPPFRADSPQATLSLVQKGQVRRLRRSQPKLPLDFEAIILKCLAREPGARYASARALADDLGRFIDHREVRARPLNAIQRLPNWARREPRLAASVVGALCALLVGLGATTQQWRRANANAQRADLNAATARERLWDVRDQAVLHFSESGAGWQAAPELLASLREQESYGERQRAAAARKRLGIFENANPTLVDVLAEPAANTLAFSADGSRLAVGTSNRELRMLDTRTGKQLWRSALPDTPPNDSNGNAWSLRFSDDGQYLVATMATPLQMPIGPNSQQMLLFSAADGNYIEPPTAFSELRNASYSANGRFALLTDMSGRAQMWKTGPWHELSPLLRLGPAQPDGAGPSLVAPDGRFFVTALPKGAFEFFDASTLTAHAMPRLGEFGQPSAWVLSPDAHWLAVGDAEGHVRMIDCETRDVRALTPQSSQGVRGLAFSADGTWLAAATGESGVFLWDWRQGQLLASPFGGNPPTDQVALDRVHDRVMTSSYSDTGDGAATLWEIAPALFDMDRTSAVQIGGRVATLGSGGSAAIAWNPATQMLASVRNNDARNPFAGTPMLRLARLPATVLKTAHGAPVKPMTLHFDGQRLVSVIGSRVQIMDAGDEAPLGNPIDVGHAPGFAELTDDGNSLVVSVGREVRAYDTAKGAPRFFAPITLDNSPQHVELSPDGRHVLTTWLDHAEDGVGEEAELWNLSDGLHLAGPVRLPGPIDGLRYSADGHHFLIWTRHELSERDADTLAPVPGPLGNLHARALGGKDDTAAWTSATFDNSGAVLAVLGGTIGKGREQTQLLHFDGAGKVQHRSLWPVIADVVPVPGSDRLLIASEGGASVLLAANGSTRDLQGSLGTAPERAIAIGADGRWIARALRDGVDLFDARDATRIAHLHASLLLPDRVWQLAFSADGKHLLGRSLRNRYLVWNLQPDMRAIDVIEREFVLRGMPGALAPTTADIGADERAALRASDPGPAPVSVSPEPTAIRQLAGGGIPPRGPKSPSNMLDLGNYYNFALAGVDRSSLHTAGDFGWLPQGMQRLLGVDYDLRGLIQLHDPAAPYSGRIPIPASVRVDLPAMSTAAALDVLMLEQFRGQPGKATAAIGLTYRNGEHANLPIVFGTQVWDYWHSAIGNEARLAARGWDTRALQVRDQPAHVYAIRLRNPHSQWPIDALTLQAVPGGGGAPAFLAITVEPATAATPDTR